MYNAMRSGRETCLDMKLKQPISVKEKLMKRRNLATIKDIARELKMSNHTVAKVLSGEPVRPATIQKIAAALEVTMGDIATFVDMRN